MHQSVALQQWYASMPPLTGDKTESQTYTVAFNGMKLSVAETNEAYAILNNRAFKGYKGLTVNYLNSTSPVSFVYENDYLKGISAATSANFGWSGTNLSQLAFGDTNYNFAYGEELNDANLDLNWFITRANCGVTAGSNALEALNLLGKRSENLVSSCNGVNYTYAVGDKNLTVNVSDGSTIVVTF